MSIAVVEKTFSVLEILAGNPEPMALARLAEGAELPKPTIYRILQTLATLGYVAQSESSDYYLTNKLGNLAENSHYRDLRLRVLPFMDRTYRKFNETVNLGVLHGVSVHYVHVLETTRPLRMMVQPNAIDEFYSTAIGRAIAAFLPADERDSIIHAAEIRPITPQTIKTKAELVKVLKETRQRGYALEAEETSLGVSCIGIPVLRDGYPVAGISVTVPNTRLTDERRAEIAAHLLSEQPQI